MSIGRRSPRWRGPGISGPARVKAAATSCPSATTTSFGSLTLADEVYVPIPGLCLVFTISKILRCLFRINLRRSVSF